MDATLDRDRTLFAVLVTALIALSLVFGVLVWRAADGSATVVPAASSASPDAAFNAANAADASGAPPDAAGATGTGVAPKAVAAASAPPLGDAAAAKVIEPGGEIVVGSVVSETGAVAFPGVAAALRAYFAMVNADGGINGHPVRLVLYDDGLDPARARQAFHKLIVQDHVVAIVGSFSPLGEAGAISEMEKAGVALLPASGLSAPAFTSPIAWFLTGTLAGYGQSACKEALAHGQKRVAFVYIDSELIEPILGPYEKCIKDAGGDVLREAVQLGQPDYTATALRIKQFGAQLIFHEIAQSATIQLWQALDRQGVTAQSQLVPGSDIKSIRSYTGPAGESASIQSNVLPPHLDTPALRTFKAAIDRFQPGADINSLAVDKWVGCLLFTDVLRRLGDNISRQSIMAEIARTKDFTGDGLTNPITYSMDHHTGTEKFWWFEKSGPGFGDVGQAHGP